MDGENNGKPYEQMDDLGVPLFLETPKCCGTSTGPIIPTASLKIKFPLLPRRIWFFSTLPSPLGIFNVDASVFHRKHDACHILKGVNIFLSPKVLFTSTASPLPFSSPELPPLQTGFEHGLCQSQQCCRENCSIALEPLITAILRHSFNSCRNRNGIMQTEMRTHSNQSKVKR